MKNGPFPPIAFEIERQIQKLDHLIEFHGWWITGTQAQLHLRTHEGQVLALRFTEGESVRLSIGPLTLNAGKSEAEVVNLVDLFVNEGPWTPLTTQVVDTDEGELRVQLTLDDAQLHGSSLDELLLEGLWLHHDAVADLGRRGLLPSAAVCTSPGRARSAPSTGAHPSA